MADRIVSLLFFCVLTCVLVLMNRYCLMPLVRSIWLKRSGTRVMGVVVDVERLETEDTVYDLPHVRYHTDQGVLIGPPKQAGHGRYEPGQEIAITYDPRDPAFFWVDEPGWMPLRNLLVFLFVDVAFISAEVALFRDTFLS